MKAIQPELVSALDAFGERAVIEKVAEAVGPLSILGGKSLADVLTMVLRGTGLEKAAALVENTKNGASAPAIRS
jgi:major vault protein